MLAQTLNLIRSLGIKVMRDYDIPAGKAEFKDGQYIIRYNPQREDLEKVLLHELAHILRGDLLPVDYAKTEEDYYFLNVAEDSIINHQLGFNAFEYLSKGQWIPVLYQTIPWDKPLQITDKREIYEYLKTLDKQHNFSPDVERVKNEDIQKAKQELERIITQAYLDNPELLKQLARIPKIIPFKPVVCKKEINRINAFIEKLTKICIQYGQKKAFTKTIDNRDRNGLFIRAPKPSLSVAVFCDVSGSMMVEEIINKALSISKEFNYEADIFYFSGEVSKKVEDIAGGTTLFYPCVQILERKKYDAIVIISDFEIFDFDKCKDARALLRYKKRTILVPVVENKEVKKWQKLLEAYIV